MKDVLRTRLRHLRLLAVALILVVLTGCVSSHSPQSGAVYHLVLC